MSRKKKIFISFDFDNDKNLKDSLIGQSKLIDSPFEVIDGSMKEAAPDKEWVKKAKSKIQASDTVIVMLGTKTFKAPGVLKEVKIANALKIGIIQIIGYKDKVCPGVKGAGRPRSWTWDNLKTLLA